MAGNPVAANLLMLVVMIGGLASVGGITKEVFPTFPSETVTITVPYPGSSPEEVEEGIVRKIEEAVRGVDQGEGVLLLTDMFGGTPTNLALALLEPGKVEIVTGANLPMLIKCTNVREEMSLHDTAVQIAEEARAAIHVAGQVLSAPAEGEAPA